MAKKSTKKTAAVTNELGKLAPKPIVWEFGERTYEQRPLRISRLSDVMEEVIDTVVGGGREALLNDIVSGAESGAELSMAAVVRMLASIPKHLPKIASMILVDAEEDEDYLDEFMGARNGVAVIKTFIEQNEVGALIQDFFGLVQSVNMNVGQAVEENEAEAEMTKVISDSAQEPETEED